MLGFKNINTQNWVWKIGVYAMAILLVCVITTDDAYSQRRKKKKKKKKARISQAELLKAEADRFYDEAISLYGQKDYEGALDGFNKTLEKLPQHERALFNRGVIFVKLEQPQKGFQDFKTLSEINPTFPKVWLNMGLIRLQGNDLTAALFLFEQELRYHRNYYEPYYYSGVIHFLDRNYTMALARLDSCIIINPDFSPAYHDRAGIFRVNNQFDKALADYKKAIQLNPYNAQYHSNLASLYRVQGEFAKAIDMLEKAIRIDPENPIYHNNMGLIYFEQGNFEEALPLFQTALEVDQEYYQARNNLGATLLKLGKYAESLNQFNQALLKQNNNGYILLNRGIASENLFHTDDACSDWKTCEMLNVPKAKQYLMNQCQ